MIGALDAKYVAIEFAEALVDNASVSTASIDTRGFDYCEIVAYLGTTDIALTALKVQDSDDDSTYADVDGLDMDGDTDIEGTAAVLPSATDDDNFIVFQIDCRGRKRYLDLVATFGDGTAGGWLHAFARLSRAKELPSTNAEYGAETVLRA